MVEESKTQDKKAGEMLLRPNQPLVVAGQQKHLNLVLEYIIVPE